METRLEPALYKEVPYDWRLNISLSHLNIAEEIKGYFDELDRVEHPFLHNKLSIAGHSTGGVIMRGFTYSNNAIKDLIEHFFFINVPHLGAPKAEYVYFSGDMEIPIVALESFRQMGPDMPILYFLTACSRYGSAVSSGSGNVVSEDWTPSARQTRVQNAINAGAYDTEKKELYGYPEYENEGPLTFNMPLALAADKHCEDAAAAGPSTHINSYVFHSGGRRTITSTRLVDDEILSTRTFTGDGTVPTVSQIGDIGNWANATLFEPTPENPLHVPAPNSIWIWERIFDVLIHTPVDAFTIDFPQDMRDASSLIFEMARAVHGGGDSQDVSETINLTAGGTKIYVHEDMDCGMAFIECLNGSVEVEASYQIWWSYSPIGSAVTLNTGQFMFLDIPEQGSVNDQDNRIKLTANGGAEVKIDFLSVDV